MTAAFPYATTVDIAAASKDMTVKATVKAELGITGTTDDAQIDATIHQASALIVGHSNREFAEEKVTDKYRPRSYASGAGIDVLWLSRTPVTTIHAVVEDGVTLAATKYELNPASGELWRLDDAGERSCWPSGVLITVQHTSGYQMLGTLPHDLERACVDQVKAMFVPRQRDPTLRAETVPDVHQVAFSVAGGDSFGASGLLLSVEGALAPYKRWTIA